MPESYASHKTSLSKTDWHFPDTKRKALDLKEIGARVSIDENLYGNLIALFQSIGADNELPSNKADRVSYINNFHRQLAVNNPHWPEHMDFGFVYGAFVNALMYGRVELHGHNIRSFIQAFKGWITQPGVLDNLERDYFGEPEPEDKPDTKLEEWPDKWIRSQYETITMIFDDGNGNYPIFQTSGAKSYFNRIKSEYESRGL